MNNTDEWWDINGVSLHQYGWSVTTFGGSRYDLPPVRGENLKLAYRPGSIYRPKVPDERTVELVMWVNGFDPATGLSTGDDRQRFNDSWDFLRRLVWKPSGTQITLTRRWKLTVGGVPTVVAASALAEVSDTMTPTMTGRTRADFTMTLLLNSPYFFSNQITTPAIPVDGGSITVTNPGYDVAAYGSLQVDLIGPLTSPRLTNHSPEPNVWVHYNDTIPSGQTVRLDIDTFQATNLSTGRSVVTKINHSGARHWMGLLPGDNQIALDDSAFHADASDGASAVLRFRPPYV